MIGQKKRLTASAARRKHSVTAAIFDCCTLICRIGEKLAVYPSQIPRVLHNVAERGKFIVPLITIHAIGNGDQAHIVLREKLLRQLANLYVVATHPGEVFNKHGRDIPGLDSGQHFLKSGALHGGAGNAIVYEKQGICIAFFPCYL